MFFGKIGEDRIIVIAIRRRGKTPARLTPNYAIVALS
jgi:hypothetical protein